MTDLAHGFVVHHLNDWNNLPIMERWFHREHAPDVKGPAMLRYDMYRAVNPPPEGAEKFCFMNYRVHETISIAMPLSMNGQPSMRAESVEDAMNVAMFSVPYQPDYDLWGAQRRPFETPVIRWLTVFKYPDGVAPEEGDKWYFETHVPEIIDKAGDKVKRMFSYTIIPNAGNAATQHQKGSNNEKNFHLGFGATSRFLFVPWHRMTEIWFETGHDWTLFVNEVAPLLTRPSWASQETYPFMKPGEDFCSTFLLERPSEDLLVNSETKYYG